jgi:hypothetical protein
LRRCVFAFELSSAIVDVGRRLPSQISMCSPPPCEMPDRVTCGTLLLVLWVVLPVRRHILIS